MGKIIHHIKSKSKAIKIVCNTKYAEFSNLSMEESLSLFAPMESDGSGLKPSQCQMYNVNYTQVLEVNKCLANLSWFFS